MRHGRRPPLPRTNWARIESDPPSATAGRLSADVKHRTCKYLNNIIEADHDALKTVIQPTRGFQTMKTAAATIRGFEVMRMIRRGHCLTCKPHVEDEMPFVKKLFDIFAVTA